MNEGTKEPGRETNKRPKGVRKRLRGLFPIGAAGAFAMLAAVMLMTPLASATSPMASFTAPYTGATAVHYRDPVAQGCGAHLTVSVPAAFTLATGTGVGYAKAKSTPCATADSQSSYDGIVGARGLTFTATSGGAHTITGKWTVTWNASATMTSTAANAGAQATVEIYLQVKLTDLTTHTTINGKALFIVLKDLQTGTSYAGGQVAKLYSVSMPSVTLTSGHSYAITAILGFSAQAVVPAGSPAGAVVSAAVDLGSSNHGGVLNSVVVR
jgi:hypothetical protein